MSEHLTAQAEKEPVVGSIEDNLLMSVVYSIVVRGR